MGAEGCQRPLIRTKSRRRHNVPVGTYERGRAIRTARVCGRNCETSNVPATGDPDKSKAQALRLSACGVYSMWRCTASTIYGSLRKFLQMPTASWQDYHNT